MAILKHYGKVKLISYLCATCGEKTLGPCCGINPAGIEITSNLRCSSGTSKRLFSKTQIDKRLELQDYKCFWCSRDLKNGIYLTKNGSVRSIRAVGDHLKPFCYDQDTSNDNLVVACNICNTIKSSRVFDCIEKMRSFILDKIKAKDLEIFADEVQLQDP